MLDHSKVAHTEIDGCVDTRDCAPGWHLLPIRDLPAWIREAMDRRCDNWFNSLSFATLYANPAATHVACRFSEQGTLIHALPCYTRRWLGAWRLLHLLGPAGLAADEVHTLLCTGVAHLATLHRMGEDLPPSIRPVRFTVHRTSEDFVIELAATPELYLQSLGDRTRRQIRQHLHRLHRELGDRLQVRLLRGPEIDPELCTELVALNRRRRASKGSRHLWTRQMLANRSRLAQQEGLFCGIYDGTALIAGTICHLHRDEAYSWLLAHDMSRERMNPGKLVMWFALEHLIQLGMRRHHLLWGHSPYKARFGAIEHPLYDITVFRTPGLAVLWQVRQCLAHLCPCLKTLVLAGLGSRWERVVRGCIGRLLLRRQPVPVE